MLPLAAIPFKAKAIAVAVVVVVVGLYIGYLKYQINDYRADLAECKQINVGISTALEMQNKAVKSHADKSNELQVKVARLTKELNKKDVALQQKIATLNEPRPINATCQDALKRVRGSLK